MRSRPSRAAEAILAIFVPCACREEILGDLHERYRSPLQYGLEALRTIPLVIISRVRRTADPQVLLIQAFALYISFVGAAWFKDAAILREQWGLLRLAIPAGMVVLGVVLDDTYARPGPQSPLMLVRAPFMGIGLALATQGMLYVRQPDLTVPILIVLYGSAASLLLSSGIRMSFPPAANQLHGPSVPTFWLKHTSGKGGSLQGLVRVLKAVAAIVVVVIVGWWLSIHTSLPGTMIVPLLFVLSVAYLIWRRR
jgi:hypothetical protein